VKAASRIWRRKSSIRQVVSMLVSRSNVSLLLVMLAMVIDPTSAIAQKGWHVRSQYSIAPPAAYATVSPGSTVLDDPTEYEDLKLSTSVRRLAHLLRLSPQMTFYLCCDFNFFLMLALVCWKGWPRLEAAFDARSRRIKRALEEAEQFGVEARKRIAEIEKRWARLDSEIASIQRVSDAVLKHEEQALRAKTVEDTCRIIRYSEDEIKAAAQRTRRELKAFAGDLAVSIARQSMRVDVKTDQGLIRTFLRGLEESGKLSETTMEGSAHEVAHAAGA
jgi:F0F1-type ATP synthase membrane subunit b/b'